MKILCLEENLESCAKALHPRHLRQVHQEAVSTLLFIEGKSGGYVKDNANTRAWKRYSSFLFMYIILLEKRMDVLNLDASKHGAKLSIKVHKAFGPFEPKDDMPGHYPSWFGSKATVTNHRGWVTYKSEKHQDLKEHYGPMYKKYQHVSKAKFLD